MKALTLNEHALFVAQTTVKVVITLLICQIILLSHHNADLLPFYRGLGEVLRSSILAGVIGTVWMQTLHK